MRNQVRHIYFVKSYLFIYISHDELGHLAIGSKKKKQIILHLNDEACTYSYINFECKKNLLDSYVEYCRKKKIYFHLKKNVNIIFLKWLSRDIIKAEIFSVKNDELLK